MIGTRADGSKVEVEYSDLGLVDDNYVSHISFNGELHEMTCERRIVERDPLRGPLYRKHEEQIWFSAKGFVDMEPAS